jgi:hypothetical protein
MWSSLTAKDVSHESLISSGFSEIKPSSLITPSSSHGPAKSIFVTTKTRVWCFDLKRYLVLSISEEEGDLVLSIKEPEKQARSRRLGRASMLLGGNDWSDVRLVDGPMLLLYASDDSSSSSPSSTATLRFVSLCSAESVARPLDVRVLSQRCRRRHSLSFNSVTQHHVAVSNG